MTNATAAAILEEQAASLGIHSKACREGTAETTEIYSEGCAACAPALAAYIDWELHGEARAVEAYYDRFASIQTEIDSAHGI